MTPEPAAPVDWKDYVDEKVQNIERAVDVAREGIPPHVTIQEFLQTLDRTRDRYEDKLEKQRDRYEDKLAVEREKGIQLALASADKLEQERIARATDRAELNKQVTELTRELSDVAIAKAETANEKQIESLKEQIGALREEMQGLVTKMA
jgi:hypothetical protein